MDNTLLDEDLLKVKLTHDRIPAIKCWEELLGNRLKTVGAFNSRIGKIADEICSLKEDNKYFDKGGKDGANLFRGDVFEIFAEYTLRGYGRLLKIYNISKIKGQDTGVDFEAWFKDDVTGEIKKVLIQIKGGNYSEEVEYFKRKLHNFHFTSIANPEYRIGKTSRDQLFLFTMANGIHYTVDEFFHGRLRFICPDWSQGIVKNSGNKKIENIYGLKEFCDRETFWSTFQHMIGSYLNDCKL